MLKHSGLDLIPSPRQPEGGSNGKKRHRFEAAFCSLARRRSSAGRVVLRQGEEDRTPKWLQEKYGLTDVYADSVPTPDGSMQATIIPVTLQDGTKAQLIVP